MKILSGRKSLYPPVLFSIIILVGFTVLPGCVFNPTEETPTPTFTATGTEVPTPTIDWFPATPTPIEQTLPSPTPQPTTEDMRVGVTELLINDDFSDESLWETLQSPAGNIAFGSNNLSLAIAKPAANLISMSQHQLPENFYLEITYQTSLCQPQDQIGILFLRQSESDYYRLLIDCAGRTRLELIQGGRSSVLQNWETGLHIQPGAPAENRLGLWVFNGQFQLYINDTFQFARTIVANQQGGLGVFAKTINDGPLTVKFSDLQVFKVEAD